MNSALFSLKACRRGEVGAREDPPARNIATAAVSRRVKSDDLSFLGHLARACKSKSIFWHQLVQRARNNSRLRNIERAAPARFTRHPGRIILKSRDCTLSSSPSGSSPPSVVVAAASRPAARNRNRQLGQSMPNVRRDCEVGTFY